MHFSLVRFPEGINEQVVLGVLRMEGSKNYELVQLHQEQVMAD